ncbi:Imm1 family immunity protein [Streptomyces sp. NPDC001553]|uniref:Imm1 family immunity protein n=1 Tax=Streptomyces sp. NPDC001553 TaxID=3154385 RepID=UPI0033172CF9
MRNLKSEGYTDSGGYIPGETANFHIFQELPDDPEETVWPDNVLRVGINSRTGYGGFIWYVTVSRWEAAIEKPPSGYWVSENPSPPNFDPAVTADPGFPINFAPRSTVPLQQVRSTLEEFCFTGTGDRPEGIAWISSDGNGRILAPQGEDAESDSTEYPF